MMHSETIDLNTITKMYDSTPDKQPTGGNIENSSISKTTALQISLTIENPTLDIVLCPPKSNICMETFNPNVRDSQNHNIVEYFSHTPCAMSSIKVLQNCPTQRRNLLSTIGGV